MPKKLPKDFYERPDVVRVARDLIGKGLFTRHSGHVTGGIIVETEAYSWTERGCHAYRGRKTDRNAVMFEPGGRAYVYLCYGVHHLFNIVTNRRGVADAVLIRALEPTRGRPIMESRRGALRDKYGLTSGPGKLAEALAIDRKDNAALLWGTCVWVEELGIHPKRSDIVAGPRIGLDYAGADAQLPWRFTLRRNPWVSRA